MCLKLLKMPGGRPRKRHYHFSRQPDLSRALESTSLQLNDEGHVMNDQENADNQVKPDSVLNTVRGGQSIACAVIPLTEEDESTLTLNTEQLMTGSAIGTQKSTLYQDRCNDVSNALRGEQSKPCAMMPITQENEGTIPLNTEQINSGNAIGIQESTLNQDRPVRSSKVQCLQILASYSTVERQKRLEYLRQRASARRASESTQERLQRLEYLRKRASARLASESADERQRRLEYQRKRASARLASESADERQRRLENLRKRASARLASESTQERLQRLEYQRKRASIRWASQSTQERLQRLEYQRKRASLRRVSQSIQKRTERLEKQRRRQARYEMALQNQCPTYKVAVTTDASHFPGEHVSNGLHRDFDVPLDFTAIQQSKCSEALPVIVDVFSIKEEKKDKQDLGIITKTDDTSVSQQNSHATDFEEDKDYQYLMGILPQLRELTKELKQKFKNDVQNLLTVAVIEVEKLKRKATADDSSVSQQNSHATDSNFEEDKDYQYLMGILPQLKELPKELKQNFKNDVHNLLTVAVIQGEKQRRKATETG